MAKVKTNPIIEQLRGKVGDLVFKRYGDSIIISRKPNVEGGKSSEAQQATRERFREAAVYGKMVMADPETKALYDEAAEAKGKPVFSLTIADFFNAPSVEEVDLSGYAGRVEDPIIIRAHDDFDVMGVHVTIADSSGQLVEEGEATEPSADSGHWVYTATQPVPVGTTVRITVTAKDRPGGKGEVSKEKVL